MANTDYIARNKVGNLIPIEYYPEIFKAAAAESVVLANARRLRDMERHELALTAEDALPLAYFTNGDTYQTSNLCDIRIDYLKTRNTCESRNLRIISTECRSDMHDTCTVLCSHIVARNDAESAFARIEPWDELLVADANEVCTLERAVLVELEMVNDGFGQRLAFIIKKLLIEKYEIIVLLITNTRLTLDVQ